MEKYLIISLLLILSLLILSGCEMNDCAQRFELYTCIMTDDEPYYGNKGECYMSHTDIACNNPDWSDEQIDFNITFENKKHCEEFCVQYK